MAVDRKCLEMGVREMRTVGLSASNNIMTILRKENIKLLSICQSLGAM